MLITVVRGEMPDWFAQSRTLVVDTPNGTPVHCEAPKLLLKANIERCYIEMFFLFSDFWLHIENQIINGYPNKKTKT